MANRRQARPKALIFLTFVTILFNGCAVGPTPESLGPTTQQFVVTEYLLTKAGFQPWAVNMDTPKRQALMDAIPKGKIMTYMMNGGTYHVYSDAASQTLYVGDELAFQRYLFMAQGKQLCERVDATDSQAFWSCFDEFQQAGKGLRGK